MKVKETRQEFMGGAGRLFRESRIVEVETLDDARVGAEQVSDDEPVSDWAPEQDN